MKAAVWAVLLLLGACAAAPDSSPTKRDHVPADESSYVRPKYFREAYEHAHYDKRYFKEILGDEPHRDIIRMLIQTYHATFRELGIETWLMHGSLLGWFWGKKAMPWDLDADVQVSEADMYYLAAYHNMTTYYYKHGNMTSGRLFLLDINPHFTYRGRDDYLNFIDARWIDMESGLFIDVTAARYDPDHEAGEGMLYDKNDHEFRDTFLYPLRQTTFEGVPAKIPYKYKEMLESEYGKAALVNREFHGHVFDNDQQQWVLAPRKGL